MPTTNDDDDDDGAAAADFLYYITALLLCLKIIVPLHVCIFECFTLVVFLPSNVT